MKQEDIRAEAKKLAGDIQEQIKIIFAKHRQRVDSLNDLKKFGGPLNKNDKSEKIYAQLAEVSRQLKFVEKKVHDCQKLRKERRELFERKTSFFNDAVTSLSRNKNIRIKVDAQIQKLIAKSNEVVQFTMDALTRFQKQSSAFCGKAYDNKPAVEKGFLELAELGFLWDNIAKFDSVTNDSVKELYLPVDYDPNEFRNLENQLLKIWPQPREIQRVVYQKSSPPPPPPPQIIQHKSELQLAHQLLFGFTRSKETQKAINLYLNESTGENANPTALNALGQIYEQGKEVPKDIKKAFNFYKKAADKRDPEGLYRVGKFLEKGLLNFKQHFDGLYANRQAQVRGGIEYYQKAAGKGHLDAITDLGYIYQKGILNETGDEYIVQPHPEHAIKYYEKAKREQFPRALNNLGNLLITQNMANIQNYAQNANLQKGIKYLEMASGMKNSKALINLGKCYLTATGTELNIEKARGLFKDAASLGEPQGRLEYIKSYIGCSLEDVATMNDLIESARQVLLENGNNAEALYIMGVFEEKGIGVTSNKEASFHYIAAAARLDYPPALTRLGDYYYSGYFVGKNIENAKILYEKAGEKGDSQALLNLAIMHEKGLMPHGSTLGQAEELYRKAQEMGNTNATLIKGLKKQGSILKNSKVIQAAEQGNLRAMKFLNQNDKLLMNATSNDSQFKKRSTFYLKQTNFNKRTDKSFC